MRRSVASAALVVLGATLLAGAVLTMYVRDTLVDGDEFADRAAVAFSTPEVRTVVTDSIVDQITFAEPELLLVRPVLVTVVDGVLRSDLTTDIVRAGVADLHRTLFTNETDTVTLQLAELVLVAKTQLTVLDPEIGALVPGELTDAIVSVDTEQLLVDTVQLAEDLRLLAFLLPVAAIVAFVAAVWVSPAPRRTLVAVGLAATGVAVSVLVVERLVRWSVISGDDEVAGSVWDAFVADLGTWALVVAGVGAMVSTVAWFGVGEIEARGHLDRLGWMLRRRTSTWARIGWGVGALLAGVALVVEWRLAVRFAATVAGASLVVVGLWEILAVVVPARPTAATPAVAVAARPIPVWHGCGGSWPPSVSSSSQSP